MKPIDANSSTYIDFGINYYDKDPKFKMGNHVKTSKYKKVLQKFTHQIGLRKFLRLKKLKTLFLAHILLVISTLINLLEPFMKNICKRQIKKSWKSSQEKIW